jgi:hypothetical protein
LILSRSACHANRAAAGHARYVKIMQPPMDRLRDYVHFAPRNQTSPLIRLNYRDTSGNDCRPAGFHANIRNQMRLFSVLASGLLMASALCQTAIAQTPDCKSITDPATRLACYDKATPPAAASAAARPMQRAVPASKVDGSQYVDSIAAEDAIMNAKIKGICHGC